ncbi:MAG: 4Fe-4S dicluster domain-containing protein [Candidatus Tectomicrobia bacterium]|uniref:4Fe-4S dicluster domain-containing protein n=1 Tax=Tectimicrobiota bacterium TaxID=2528274 RepID=A0A932GSI8_UNCTE|nr:4Fe-4S dicluster domain-containing protein [Candidatus Tectomicrobia bacterium]
MLIDFTRCIGCKACVAACKERNNLPPEEDADLTSRTLTVVNRRNGLYVSRLCMNCREPACASACPVGALQKRANGPVVYDKARCIGCRYCLLACPFRVPAYEWDKPLPKVMKCDFCAERQAAGKLPACVEVCPVSARIFGDREELLAEAKARIRKNPERYVRTVYGEKEVGGTSMLLLSSVPFDHVGYATAIGSEPLPSYTWKALSKIPKVVLAGGVFLYGLVWIVNRRNRLAGGGPESKEMEGKSR